MEKTVHFGEFSVVRGASKLQKFRQRNNPINSTSIVFGVVVFFFEMFHLNKQEVKIKYTCFNM